MSQTSRSGCAQRASAAGTQPLTGPGGTQVLIEDPAGNPVELFSPRD